MAAARITITPEEIEERYAKGERDFQGVILKAANLRGAILTGINLSGAGLSHATLSDALLGGADLSEADLSGADLSGANLRHARLSYANLIDANLSGANLTLASLTCANLSGTNLNSTIVIGTDLSGAVLEGSRSAGTTWSTIDLSSAVGLKAVIHRGPSSVGIDTIVRSGGNIPAAFLRGCGVPEHIIDLQRSLVQGIAPIQFYSCFISYSHKDEEFVKRLHGRLQQEGLRVWFAPEEMKGGRKLETQIDEAIRVHDKLLLVLSKASMSSEWVATEISKARKRERKEGKQVLFPIRLVDFDTIREWECFDADAGKDSAREIRESFIPDFSNWKDHDAFETAFARLLKDLRASAE